MASLPKPKETDWELELPEEHPEINGRTELSIEDAAERDQRNRLLREAAERADFKRRTQVLQRGLPRPSSVDADALLKNAAEISDLAESAVAREIAFLIINDALKYPDVETPTKVIGSSRPLDVFDDDALNKARQAIAREMPSIDTDDIHHQFERSWIELHESSPPDLIKNGDNNGDNETEIIGVILTFSPPFQSHILHLTQPLP